MPDSEGLWFSLEALPDDAAQAAAERLRPVLGTLFHTERRAIAMGAELANRYEEIDLLYGISEILGQTLHLEEASRTILREVSGVVAARRSSIMVYDEALGRLRVVATRGFQGPAEASVSPDDPESVAARAYRERRLVENPPGTDGLGGPRGYRGGAYLSVPIIYAAPGGASRCVGVINLTDRLGADAFEPGHRKLVTAVANQVGAAIENARLVVRDLQQQRLRRELELAHNLQLKLMPSPAELAGDADVAARCLPAESVGGDFYTFNRFGRGRVGVMLGDVSSHGFGAALVMAMVIAAAGIHAGGSATPDETLERLLDSIEEDLASTEMFLTVFYGVLDPRAEQLSYASAGHPHAWRMPASGAAVRLEATAPPLGLAARGNIELAQVPWRMHEDLLCLCTDGLLDARDPEGEAFGEARLLEGIAARRHLPPEEIVAAMIEEVRAFAPHPADDITLLVLRI
ncbi:MAG TPA: GAF domain-containing SpoIIE family protein phosphatase [Gemmatimonadales bacterium]|nr:GAF domain-containing SpoIIE family protein phosphatase [Gemmatimonadales bacterium]